MGHVFNVHLRDGTRVDESPCLRNTGMAFYSRVWIQTQVRQLRGDCAYISGLGHPASPCVDIIMTPRTQNKMLGEANASLLSVLLSIKDCY